MLMDAQLSADGKEFYTFDTPTALTKVSLEVSGRWPIKTQGPAGASL